MRPLALSAWVLVAASCAQPLLAGPRPSPHWRNTIDFLDDPFAHPSPWPQPRWIKFTILTADPEVVYFQDSGTYDFHYEFALAELEAFAGFTPSEFDAVTLHAAGQQAILGAVEIVEWALAVSTPPATRPARAC